MEEKGKLARVAAVCQLTRLTAKHVTWRRDESLCCSDCASGGKEQIYKLTARREAKRWDFVDLYFYVLFGHAHLMEYKLTLTILVIYSSIL